MMFTKLFKTNIKFVYNLTRYTQKKEDHIYPHLNLTLINNLSHKSLLQ